MASKKKPDILRDKDNKDKKKFPLLIIGKSKGSEKNTDKNEASSTAAADTAVTAAVLHSDDTNKPATSKKGHIKKGLTKLFKKSNNNGQTKNTSKKENITINQLEKEPESKLASPQMPQETEPVVEHCCEVSPKIESDEVGDEHSRREKAASKIQAVFRGHTERRKYLQKRQNIIKIEALTRGFLARKHVTSMKTSREVTLPHNGSKEPLLDKIQSENLITF